MIAALFVAKGGVYFGRPDVDPWDEARDARKYAGPHPVVAHPPCARWGRYWNRKGASLGDDAGCFASALASVRRHGGVIEHPAGSRAWAAHDLHWPKCVGWSGSSLDGWTCEVYQGNYGHVAPKKTWLYVWSTNGQRPLSTGLGGISQTRPRREPFACPACSHAARVRWPPDLDRQVSRCALTPTRGAGARWAA